MEEHKHLRRCKLGKGAVPRKFNIFEGMNLVEEVS